MSATIHNVAFLFPCKSDDGGKFNFELKRSGKFKKGNGLAHSIGEGFLKVI